MAKKDQEQNLIKRGRYALYNPETGKPATFQRVTRFAGTFDDKEGLIGWTAQRVAKGMAHEDADHLLIQAANTSVDDRGAMDRIWQAAKKLAGGDKAAEDGTTIHHLTESLDRGEEGRIPAKWRGHIERYKQLIEQGPLEIVPEYIERVVVNTQVGTAGTFDRLCRVKRDTTVAFPSGKTVELKAGEWVVLDVKSSKSLYYSQLGFSIQFACYANSKYLFNTETERYEDLPEINKQVAFIAWIPSTKQDGELVAVDIETGWEAAQEAVKIRKFRNNKKLTAQTLVLGQDQGDDTFAGRIKAAKSRDELNEVWREANSVGAWSPALEALGKNRISELGL